MASSSSSSSSCSTHDVFISFRGEDTRKNFTSHLHAKLIEKNIDAYIDHDLPKGGDIGNKLTEAIRGSRISVIIFSKDYASSTWCLKEVAEIMECEEKQGQIVVPVFYHIDPSHVRKQSIACKGQRDRKQVADWRLALGKAADKSGWDLQTYKGTEAEFVEEIANDILMKLNDMYSSSNESKSLVGIDKSIEEVERLLCIDDSETVRMIGIWGMGGLGKTTLATLVFQKHSSEFEGCCFLENVREESEKKGGLKDLEKKLLSDLFQGNHLNPMAKEKLHSRKVLIALDDVNDPEQLKVLAEQGFFGRGSRILVTTRDLQVLRDRADETYKLEGLAPGDALKLFQSDAFQKNSPTADDVKFSKRVVKYADGNPLALKVLGSFFRSRKKENWEIELKKLKGDSNDKISSILKISFEALNQKEKDIFLDIICLFRTKFLTCRKLIERRLYARCPSVTVEIENLIDKSLITVKDNNTLVIHDLLRQMGREIEQRQSKRSRFWHLRDVLENNTGTRIIEGISCCITKGDSNPIVFKKMHKLWMLDIFFYNRKLPDQSVRFHLPNSLKCLIWYSCPWKSLPSNFISRHLVELRMPYSNLEQLWSGVQDLGELKYVDLSKSKSLTEISALSQARKLVSVDLRCCGKLRKVPSLRFCDKLTSLDQSYHECHHVECQTLGHLRLDNCSALEVVENISGNLKQLHLSSTSVAEVPSSIFSLKNLECLNLSECISLKNLPTDIEELTSLKLLNLNGCSSLHELPVLPRNLIELDLSGTAIEQVPSLALKHLSDLEKLKLDGCIKLKSLSSSIYKLESLVSLDLKSCDKLETFPEISGIRVPPFSARLHSLASLDLSLCNFSELPNEICFFSSLEKLCLRGNKIKSIPESIENLSKLVELSICKCKHLKSLPKLPSSLEFLDARRCTSMRTISNAKNVLTQELRNSNHVPAYREFFYYACSKLDRNTCNNIVREFQLRTLDTAMKSLKPHGGLKKSNYPGVGICYPGCDIPTWFTYQSKYSKTVKLSSDWLSNNFLGFALCAVVAEDEIAHGFPSDLSCAFKFKTSVNSPTLLRNFNHHELFSLKRRKPFKPSTHVFMWYIYENYHDYHDAAKVSFRFHSKASKVRACGVRLLYLQDAKEFGIESNVPSGSVNSDTEEPHPKKTSVNSRTEKPHPKKRSVNSRTEEPHPKKRSVNSRTEEPHPKKRSVNSRTEEPHPKKRIVNSRTEEPHPKKRSVNSRTEEPHPKKRSVNSRTEEPHPKKIRNF